MTLVNVSLALFAGYLLAYVVYQAVLFIANACLSDPQPFQPEHFNKFNVLVPAHNEELFVPRLLTALTAQHYPADRFGVTVIADNCSDQTARVSAPSGARVLERRDETRRGKGYAIGWAIEQLDLHDVEALVVVDADSIVEPHFLHHLNLQLERGDEVIQCYNGVANPGQSWFTRLMNVSRTIANDILHPAKRKLGLSSHLMGNGMCFSTRFLRTCGWDAFSVGEDWEYYARLVIGGRYVGYSRDARVFHQESVDLKQASSQRLRWAGGRFQVLAKFGPALIAAGLRHRSLRCLDASLPLVFPNPSLGMNLTLAGLGLAVLYAMVAGDPFWALLYGSLAVAQILMFLVGVWHTDDRLGSALSLFMAPAFLLWKLGIDLLSLGGAGTRQWKVTARKLP